MLLVSKTWDVCDYLYLGIWNLNVLPWNECRREAAGDGTNQKDSKEIMKWKEKESIGKVSEAFVFMSGYFVLIE